MMTTICKVLLISLSLFNILISAYQSISSVRLRSKSSLVLLQASKGFGSKPASSTESAPSSSATASSTSSYLASLHEGNKQITQMTKLDELCLCQSGLVYGECCHRWHRSHHHPQYHHPSLAPPRTTDKVEDQISTSLGSHHGDEKESHSDSYWSPTELVRARYTAYAFGLPAFLILTTHPKHKVR